MGRETLILAVMAVVFTVPFLLGSLIAKLLRLNDLSGRIGVVLMATFMALAPFEYEQLRGRSWKDAIQLGIDLAGGTNLVYQINVKEAKEQGKSVDNATVDKMVQAIARRVNPSGTVDMTVRRMGTDRIEIIIPGADRDLVEQMKAKIVRLGSLEFGILANERDHQPWIDLANKLPPTSNEVFSEGKVIAAWREAAEGKEKDAYGQVAIREVPRRDKDGKEIKVLQFLVMKDPPEREVTGRFLTVARAQNDENGRPAVGFNFNAIGAVRFQNLTGRNLPDTADGFKRRLAILLDGKVYSAPNLISRISNAGQITGNFDMKEVNELVGVLNAGALEVPLIQTPISEFTISPLLGIDVQTKGITAILVSAVLVFVFVLVYYRVAGVVACLSLLLNLTLVVGSMAFISASFTLPGLAGLVLTIGMAVDSNVLIYERMREELAREASLRMSIQNGFDKAFSAIFDGNVTSLLTALILYMIGSDLIRGFAVSLFIGLLMSLFSCLYFGHLAFEIIERKRLVKTFTMMQFMGATNVDFLGKRMIAYVGSTALILAGLAALFVRGDNNMDIDFSGGTMVTFEFVEPQTTDDVRARLEGVFPRGVSLERLTLATEEQKATGGRRYRVRTIEQDQNVVTKSINEAFNDDQHALKRVKIENEFMVGEITEKLEGEAERFAGGHQATLKFSGPISEGIVVDYVVKELTEMKKDGNQPKYDSPQLFVSAIGTTEAEKDSNATNATPKFTEMAVRSTREIAAEDLTSALTAVQARLASSPVFEEINAFDTSVANETKIDALLAILASLVMIVAYIWFRFEKVYFGYAAVVALAHDVLVTLGCIALGAYLSKSPLGPVLLLEDFKINLGQVACLLTIVGYSLNDTIVIFDRIREIKGKSPNITPEMINASVNQTLSRTLLTALTTFIVVAVLYVAGGEGIHGFAFSMIIGVITGCYSTIYIANPVLLWLVQRENKKPKKALA